MNYLANASGSSQSERSLTHSLRRDSIHTEDINHQMSTDKIDDTRDRKSGKVEIQASGSLKKNGRPEKRADDRLETKVDIRLSIKEKKQIVAYVQKMNARESLSQSEVIRKLIFEGIIKGENNQSIDHEKQYSKKQKYKDEISILSKLNKIMIETQRVGRNVNQCTKALSSNLPPEAMAKYTPVLLTGIENIDTIMGLIREFKDKYDQTA